MLCAASAAAGVAASAAACTAAGTAAGAAAGTAACVAFAHSNALLAAHAITFLRPAMPAVLPGVFRARRWRISS